MPRKLQDAVIVDYLIGYDPTTNHAKRQMSLATILTTIVEHPRKVQIL